MTADPELEDAAEQQLLLHQLVAYRRQVLHEAARIAEQVVSRLHVADCQGCSAAGSIATELRRLADA